MSRRHRALRTGMTLAIGLAVGWALAGGRPARLRADRDDPGADDQVLAGPISIDYNSGLKIQVARDAIYYLDYRAGRLLATVPSLRQTADGTRVLDTFAERDLVADFKINAGGASPRFAMVAGTMGVLTGAWAPLYVFESSTRQVATYRVTPQSIGNISKPRFDLLEVRSFAQAPAPVPAALR